jgi:purine-cytosine permease-like protein
MAGWRFRYVVSLASLLVTVIGWSGLNAFMMRTKTIGPVSMSDSGSGDVNRC